MYIIIKNFTFNVFVKECIGVPFWHLLKIFIHIINIHYYNDDLDILSLFTYLFFFTFLLIRLIVFVFLENI